MPIEAVIFDIGNVLIEWQPERYYDRVIGEERRRAMFAEVDLHGMNDRIDRGESFRDVIYETADALPHWHDEIRMWHDNWIDLADPAIDHSRILLQGLRDAGIQVFVLSNIGVDTYAIAKSRHPFLDAFDRKYISGAMGVIKPEPEIYEMVEVDCGIAPANLLFTDDRKDNIEMAATRGWQTHHFTGAKGFADRLIAEGLLTPSQAHP